MAQVSRILTFVSGCTLGAVLCGPAAAVPPGTQLLKAPEVTMLVVASPVEAPPVSVPLVEGQRIAHYNVQPAEAIRTKTASTPRRDAFPAIVPADAILFKVQMDSGPGYCLPLQADQGVRRSQCFRDLNDDATLDAAYLTYRIKRGQSLYSGRLAGLSAMPGIGYDRVEAIGLAPEPLTYVLRKTQPNKVELSLNLGDQPFGSLTCPVNTDQPCRLGNHLVRFGLDANGLTFIQSEPTDEPLSL